MAIFNNFNRSSALALAIFSAVVFSAAPVIYPSVECLAAGEIGAAASNADQIFEEFEAALDCRNSQKITEIVSKLPDINLKKGVYNLLNVAAGHFCDTDAVTILVNKGIDVNNADSLGETPIFKAAVYGKAELIKLLAEHGADINAANRYGETAIFGAITHNQAGAVKALVERGADLKVKSRLSGQTPVSRALSHNNTAIAAIILEHLDETHLKEKALFASANDITPLAYAVSKCGADLVEKLLSKGADPNAKSGGEPVLHHAVRRRDARILNIVASIKGIDINGAGHNDRTALHLACEIGDTASITLLLKSGADPRKKDRSGAGAVETAVAAGGAAAVEAVALYITANKIDYDWTGCVKSVVRRGEVKNLARLIDLGAISRELLESTGAMSSAARNDDAGMISFLVARGVSVNARPRGDEPPVVCAVSAGADTALKILIDNSAEVDILDSYGARALGAAIDSGRISAARMLASAGKDFKASISNGRVFTPMISAAGKGYHDLIKIMADKGGDVNERNSGLETPLHAASFHGHTACVRALAEAGADVNTFNSGNETPLFYAAARGNTETAAYLLDNGADVALCGDKKPESRTIGLKIGNSAYESILNPEKTGAYPEGDYNLTPLHAAILNGRDGAAELLISRGAPGDKKTALGLTPLHACIDSGNEYIFGLLLSKNPGLKNILKDGADLLRYAVSRSNITFVKKLAAEGFDINGPGADGETPLHAAAAAGDRKMVRFLLGAGARTDVKNKAGRTYSEIELKKKNEEYAMFKDILKDPGVLMKIDAPADVIKHAIYIPYRLSDEKPKFDETFRTLPDLHKAVVLDMPRALETLISKGADIAEKNKYGRTPLETAIELKRRDIFTVLIEKGADESYNSCSGGPLLHRLLELKWSDEIKTLVEKGVSIDVTDDYGDTPLHKAITRFSNIEAAMAILSKTESLKGKEASNFYPLHEAVKNIAGERESTDLINLLLKKGADPNAEDRRGYTPLFYILDPSRNARENFSDPPLTNAFRKKISEILIAAGADVNRPCDEGRRPIGSAVWSMNIELCEYLIARGADLNVKTVVNRYAPLHHLVLTFIEKAERVTSREEVRALFESAESIFKLLLSGGADLNAQTFKGQTPLLLLLSWDTRAKGGGTAVYKKELKERLIGLFTETVEN